MFFYRSPPSIVVNCQCFYAILQKNIQRGRGRRKCPKKNVFGSVAIIFYDLYSLLILLEKPSRFIIAHDAPFIFKFANFYLGRY